MYQYAELQSRYRLTGPRHSDSLDAVLSRLRVVMVVLPVLLWPGRTQILPGTAADRVPVVVARGFFRLAGLASDPQGVPFAAIEEGGIVRLLQNGRCYPFAKTGGRTVGLAFDATGDLYAADRERKALFRITPWGQVTLAADRYEGAAFSSLGHVAAGHGGDVYFTDLAASRVYRLTAQGRVALFTSDVSGPSGIVVSAEPGHVFIADSTRTIWRFAPNGAARTRFARLPNEGAAAAMVLDQKGNLYVAHQGAGKVSVLDPKGKLIGTHSIPGRGVAGLALGGFDSKTLYIAESPGGAVYKLRIPHASQRWPWEPDQPLLITAPPDGAILNRHDGEMTADGLRVMVQGSRQVAGLVRVNGVSAEMKGSQFRAPVLLKDFQTKIVAEVEGGPRHGITVLWDRNSFPRYRFSTDDNIRFFKDIALHSSTYNSLFDNEYLAFWREMHRKYSTKVHFNIFYEAPDFNLSQMPGKFRSEWQQNADWIRLTFHARAREPSRPYLQASYEQMQQDYRLVVREIERFAGKELLSPFTTIHWGSLTSAAARALRDEGVRGLVGYFDTSQDLPLVCYYLPLAQIRYLMGRDYWKDMREDLFLVRHDIVIDDVPLERIAPHLARVAADPHQSELMELMIHEHFFLPDYPAYEPDYRARVERAIEWVTRRGYRSVFYEDGFLGSRCVMVGGSQSVVR